MTTACGEAKIKPEFVVPIISTVKVEKDNPLDVLNAKGGDENDGVQPVEKKPKLSTEPKESKRKQNRKGQNKHRPGPHKFKNEIKLCPLYWDGQTDEKCPQTHCPFIHDAAQYLDQKTGSLDLPCPIYEVYGKCCNGLSCAFGASHIQDNVNVVNTDVWKIMQSQHELGHRPIVDREVRNQLRKKNYDFKIVDKICSNMNSPSASEIKTQGAFTNEDTVTLKPDEIKKLDWNDKLYLSPLTTVGNLPFRRICVDYGADITCSEMTLATSLLQGHSHEFALVRRHATEKFWGVQLCASSGILAAKAAKVLADVGVDYDFIDLNMGCPLEPIYMQGAGSGMMCRKNKFQTTVKVMSSYMTMLGKDFTVKMRTGIKTDKLFAHTLVPFCRDNGVAMVTLHGRTKEQRYTKFANWNYIKDCKDLANPMPLYGNGDILSYEDYEEKKKLSAVSGIMIGRGALIKPWIFQEIKERRHIDISSQERLDVLRKYCGYGLDYWGSDSQGVETTRRFLLEWLSFTHRYIPYGVLVDPPQKINQRPPKYMGRDEMETLLVSSNANDWIKISEMFLGPVPDNFEFLPKHKANSWG